MLPRIRNDTLDGDSLMDEIRQGFGLERIGRAKESLRKYADTYERAREQIATLPPRAVPPQPLLAAFLYAANQYTWALYDIGGRRQAEEVARVTAAQVGAYEISSLPRSLLLPYARYEVTQRRYYLMQDQTEEARKHSQRAVDLINLALSSPNVDLETLWVGSGIYDVHAELTEGPESQDMIRRTCAAADRMMALSPQDTLSVEARVDCWADQGQSAGEQRDVKAESAILEKARGLVTDALRRTPDDVHMLLGMAYIEILLADVAGIPQDARRAHLVRAQDYFVRAHSGKTLFSSHGYRTDFLYHELDRIDFSNLDREAANARQASYFREIADAITAELDAFPQSRDLAYVTASASLHVGESLSQKARDRATAEIWLTKAIDAFSQVGVMDDLSNFSEGFADYCTALKDRIDFYAKDTKADLMLQDMDTLKTSCIPALNKYPWDLYLRQRVIVAHDLVGQSLVAQARYNEARPFLEYASHWTDSNSTKTLARLYREALGVPRDLNKAAELELLATKQGLTRYTLSADFGTSGKAPFYVYVRDWPADYPFDGIDDQAQWLKRARSGTLPPDVVKTMHDLSVIARRDKKSFTDLVTQRLPPDAR